MEAREIKGLQIAATMPLKRSTYGWQVPSQTGVGTYRVASAHKHVAHIDLVSDLTCTCPDYELRQMPCKHVIAVELTIKREFSADGEMVTEHVKVTYTQDWAAYNKAQCEEKDRFMPMLANLCSTIEQRPQGVGRPRLPMSDMAFSAVSKVYAGLSARRFDSDVRDAAAKGLTAQDPHFNSVLRYLRSPEMTPVLRNLVTISAMPLKAVEEDFAIDSTGFTTCRFERWYDHKWGKERSRHHWIKLHAMTGVRTNVVTSVELSDGFSHDTNYFPALVESTAQSFALRDVTADKAYSSKANMGLVEDLGGTPFIPFKSNVIGPPVHEVSTIRMPKNASTWTKMYHLFAYQRETFLSRYHQRSNVETTFSMIKAKFGDSLRSKSDTGQMNEVLCKVVAHNICVLIACIHEIGLDVPKFDMVARPPAVA